MNGKLLINDVKILVMVNDLIADKAKICTFNFELQNGNSKWPNLEQSQNSNSQLLTATSAPMLNSHRSIRL